LHILNLDQCKKKLRGSAPFDRIKVSDDEENIKLEDKVLLVVEDDAKFASILLDMAHKWAYKVLIANTGSMAIQLANRYIPSAIILDIQLPIVDGWEVLQALKGNRETRHIPVHILSGTDERNFGYKLGALNYLVKPVPTEKLEEAFNAFEEFSKRSVKRLLVVEDNKIEREAILELIGNNDVEINSVVTGKEALTALAKHSYDCMVLDLKLPDFSGTELLRKIHHSKSTIKRFCRSLSTRERIYLKQRRQN